MIVLFLAVAGLAAAAVPCRPPAEVQEFHRTLPADPYERRAAIEERLRRSTDDFFLHRLYLEQGPYTRRPVRERYQRLLDEHPGDLNYIYLYGRALVGYNSNQAIEYFRKVLDREPAYPWAHLALMEIYRSEEFRDPEKLRASFEAFTRACPENLEAYQFLRSIGDKELAGAAAKRLRPMLAAATEPEDLGLYSVLWATEFRLAPPAEHEAVRKQVAEDVRRVRTAAPHPAVLSALDAAARLLGDKELEKEARRRPRAGDSYMDWLRQNPRPRDWEPPERLQAWAKALLAESERWRRESPRELAGYIERLNALVILHEATPAEIEKAAEEALTADRRDPDRNRFWPGTHRVASALVKRGILIDRVPALIDEAIRVIEDPEAVIDIDLVRKANAQITTGNRMALVNEHMGAWGTLVEAYMKQDQAAKAREILRRMEDLLKSKEPGKDEKNAQVLQFYRSAQYNFYDRMGAFAEHEGRKLDALHHYRQALATGFNRDALLGKQNKLWKDLGGSDEAWLSWTNSIEIKSGVPSRPAMNALGKPLPEFKLTDLKGNPWTLANLKGKTTFINVWATWCGPCRDELPYVQKLYEKLKDRPDVQVITFSMDDNPGVIEPFLRQHGYSFPVLEARLYVEKVVPYMSAPRNWIIDRNGVLAKEQIGFGGNGDQWVEEMLKELR